MLLYHEVGDEKFEGIRTASGGRLPLIDDLERALQNVDARLAGLTWVDGIRLIYRKFQALLEIG